jgi:heme-degrading monooxygenase HmoA
VSQKKYYAVIFTSTKKETADEDGYETMAKKMEELAMQMPGYISHESARNEIGITISYWESLEAIKNWKQQSDHLLAQKLGKEIFYSNYKVRICKVEKEYQFH